MFYYFGGFINTFTTRNLKGSIMAKKFTSFALLALVLMVGIYAFPFAKTAKDDYFDPIKVKTEDYFDPIKVKEVTKIDIPKLEAVDTSNTLYDAWTDRSDNNRRTKIGYFENFKELFLAEQIAGNAASSVQVLQIESSAYDREVRPPLGNKEITLAQLIHVLQNDMRLVDPNRDIGFVSLAQFMAAADVETSDGRRLLLQGNDFGSVMCYIRDKQGNLRLVRAGWFFAGVGGWYIQVMEPEDKNGSARGSVYLFPA